MRPEALNALMLPVRVNAGFLGSVKIKVPWSRLGQEPVLLALDRILIFAEPALQVEGSIEDAIQEEKTIRSQVDCSDNQNPVSEMQDSHVASVAAAEQQIMDKIYGAMTF